MTPAPALVEQPKGNAWHSQSAEEVLARLGSSATGLSAQEAAQRLAADGPNELKEGKRISLLRIFLGQFKSLIIWILIAADVISGLLGERVDAIAILVRRSRRPLKNVARTMFFTGFLTSGVAFTVYFYILKTGTKETARGYAFAVLVFAELLRSFGARSETKAIWHISLFTNVNLVVVVAISFGLQLWSQHNATIGRFLRTSFMPFTDCLLLLAVGTIPLLVLELVKVVLNKRRRSASVGQPFKPTALRYKVDEPARYNRK